MYNDVSKFQQMNTKSIHNMHGNLFNKKPNCINRIRIREYTHVQRTTMNKLYFIGMSLVYLVDRSSNIYIHQSPHIYVLGEMNTEVESLLEHRIYPCSQWVWVVKQNM